MNAIADTGFLVALLEAHDKHHRWAMEIAEGIKWHGCPVQALLGRGGVCRPTSQATHRKAGLCRAVLQCCI
jgi:predicted nucleic acid-binding protein